MVLSVLMITAETNQTAETKQFIGCFNCLYINNIVVYRFA